MPFSHRQLRKAVRKHLPDLPHDILFEPIRTGKFNTSFWVRTWDKDFVLRIAPPQDTAFVFYERGMMRQEPELHELLREKTGIPVARIHAFDSSRRILDSDFLVMERLPGTPLSGNSLVDVNRVLRQVGEHLAELHALHGESYGYLGAHEPMEPQDRWAGAFAIMWGKLIDDVERIGCYDAEESALMKKLLDERLPLFDRDVPPSLLHMDVWAQNILVDGKGTVTGLLDWDRALWGDPEIEFAVLDYCGISEPAFWEGYGRQRDSSPEANVRRVFYLLYELQKYMVIRQGREDDQAGALAYKEQVLNVASQALG